MKFRPHMISTLSVRRFAPADDRRGVGQLEALRTFDGDYRSRDLVGRDARIMEPSVERLHDARRRPAFHADDRGRAPAQTLLTSSPSMWMRLVVAEESLQRRDGIVHRRGGILFPGRAGGSTSTRSVASVPAAGMRTVSSRSPSFSFHRILTTWLPSVLSVASMCRAVIFGSFSMRRVRFFPGHVPAVLTLSMPDGRVVRSGRVRIRTGSAWASWIGDESQNVTDPRRNPDTRFAAEDDGGRGIGAVLKPATTEDVVCARVLCLG